MKDVVEVADITPEQAEFLAKIFLASVKKEGATTSRVLHAVPVDKASYRPHENSRTALEMAWHLASVASLRHCHPRHRPCRRAR